MTNKKVVTVYKNGQHNVNGKIITFEKYEEFLEKVKVELNCVVAKIVNENGLEVRNFDEIKNDEILYVIEQLDEKFVLPLLKCENSERSLNKASSNLNNPDWITLNVGGKYFTTTKNTLIASEPNSMLARMFSEDGNEYLFTPSAIDPTGAFLIDRSPTYFEPILNYLRCRQLIYDKYVNPAGILEEAKFFGIESIVPLIEAAISKDKYSKDECPLTRRDVVEAIIKTSYTAELRFQGVNLAGADLSRLDLRNINFKYANMQGCNLMGSNLSGCCLERADLSTANLENAQLLGVKSVCANFEKASMKNCNFKDPSGIRANMEGVNLKGANLEGSDMGGVNLRVATLKNASLQNCDLRAAVLAGADLENCDLSGSDLQEANLRGANLKDAAFELMLTPLHMSQTIR